jgi:hypothetical protein
MGLMKTRTIVVAQGMCSPIRNQVLTLLNPYGVVIHGLDTYSISSRGRGADGATYAKGQYVQANVAELTVSDQAAKWVEYLICRSKKFRLMTKPLDARNQIWAEKWDTLPKKWQQNGCTATAKRNPAPTPWIVGFMRKVTP